MKTEEKIISTENIFDGKIFKVRRYGVELPDGRQGWLPEADMEVI